jgi:hypothetical protein
MRAAIGPALAHLAMLGAGFGVLRLIGTLSPITPRRVLANAGLAYLAGIGVVTMVLLALMTAGVALSLGLFAALCAVLAVPFLIGLLRPDAWRGLDVRRGLRGLDTEGRLVAAVIVGLLALAVVVTASAGLLTLGEYDAWQSWTRKALLLFYDPHLPKEIFSAHVTSEVKPDYPLLLPLFEALQMRAGGTPNESQAHIGPWLILVASIWAVCGLGARVTRPFVWVSVAGGVGVLLVPTALTAYADVPGAGFVAVGTLALGLWLHDRRLPDLLLAAIVLGAAAGMNVEGLGAAIIAFAVVVVLLGIGREWRPAGLAALAGGVALIVAVVPWRLWVSAQGIKGSVTLSESVSPAYLLDHFDRVWPSVQAIASQFTSQNLAQITIPVAIALAIVRLRDAPRLAVFYLAVGVLYVVSLVWAYWTSPYDLGFHIFTSVGRVFIGPVAIAMVALVHLSGERGQSSSAAPGAVLSKT